ncbi:MAG: hypothetical protein CM15mP77_4300 [Synechococcus sp.]|nr:MAG: hypothetical protein CM15mP77_4300 [Synechococcus sp.]
MTLAVDQWRAWREGTGRARHHSASFDRPGGMNANRVSHHLLLCATPTKAKCCDRTKV